MVKTWKSRGRRRRTKPKNKQSVKYGLLIFFKREVSASLPFFFQRKIEISRDSGRIPHQVCQLFGGERNSPLFFFPLKNLFLAVNGPPRSRRSISHKRRTLNKKNTKINLKKKRGKGETKKKQVDCTSRPLALLQLETFAVNKCQVQTFN